MMCWYVCSVYVRTRAYSLFFMIMGMLMSSSSSKGKRKATKKMMMMTSCVRLVSWFKVNGIKWQNVYYYKQKRFISGWLSSSLSSSPPFLSIFPFIKWWCVSHFLLLCAFHVMMLLVFFASRGNEGRIWWQYIST